MTEFKVGDKVIYIPARQHHVDPTFLAAWGVMTVTRDNPEGFKGFECESEDKKSTALFLSTELQHYIESDDLRDAALQMQVAVGNMLSYGGLFPLEWFDQLIKAQQRLAGITLGTRKEFDKFRNLK